jgi:hypothetical protein
MKRISKAGGTLYALIVVYKRPIGKYGRASGFLGKKRAMTKRRRFKQTKSLQDRLSEFINGERAKAESTPEGTDKYELRKKIRQAETVANIEKWANSPDCTK